jgi:hypothetical protein
MPSFREITFTHKESLEHSSSMQIAEIGFSFIPVARYALAVGLIQEELANKVHVERTKRGENHGYFDIKQQLALIEYAKECAIAMDSDLPARLRAFNDSCAYGSNMKEALLDNQKMFKARYNEITAKCNIADAAAAISVGYNLVLNQAHIGPSAVAAEVGESFAAVARPRAGQ